MLEFYSDLALNVIQVIDGKKSCYGKYFSMHMYYCSRVDDWLHCLA